MLLNEEYRGYFFTNMYLSSLQNGLQVAHCVANMFAERYPDTSATDFDNHSENEIEQFQILQHWALKHKTIIILNGGNHLELNNLYRDLQPSAHQLNLPIDLFQEDEQSLNHATTCVSIILPASVYALPLEPAFAGCKNEIPVGTLIPQYMANTPQRTLKEIISKYSLAR